MESALIDAGPAGRAGGLGQLGRGCTSARGPAFLPSLEGALGGRGQLPPLSLGWTQQQPPLPKMVGTCPPVCLPRDKGVPAGSQEPRRNVWGPWMIKGGNLKHPALVP